MAAKTAKKFAPRASSATTVEEGNGEEVKVTPTDNGDEENSTPAVSPEGADENTIPNITTPDEEDEVKGDEESSTPAVVTADEEPTVNFNLPEEPEEDITFTGTTESKPIERRVKVRLAKKFDACIGGEWYHLKKDEVAIVPENVKRILSRTEGMLKPL